MKKLKYLSILGLPLMLSGCKFALLDPKGMIAATERDLLISAVILMLLVVIPVIIMSFVFAWRYREKNKSAEYKPGWSHSTAIEVVCWTIPAIIIGILSALTWIYTHSLDPYRPLNVKGKPIIIEAIALDWKWLFIYPDQKIATINYVQIPVNQPVRFLVTADAPMNSLEIPRLAGQIYAMTGMRTKLNLIANEKGTYKGLSTNFSGDGFSGMYFKVKVTSKGDYNRWVAQTKRTKKQLSLATYNQLRKPSENAPVQYFVEPEKNLFNKIIMQYMGPGMHMTQNN